MKRVAAWTDKHSEVGLFASVLVLFISLGAVMLYYKWDVNRDKAATEAAITELNEYAGQGYEVCLPSGVMLMIGMLTTLKF